MYHEISLRKMFIFRKVLCYQVKIIEGASRPMTAEEPLFSLKSTGMRFRSIIPPEMRICKRENFVN